MQLDTPGFFLTAGWAAFKQSGGWAAQRFVAFSDEKAVAVTQLLSKSQLGIGIVWAPGGIGVIASASDFVKTSQIFETAYIYFSHLFKMSLIRFNIHQLATMESLIRSDKFIRPLTKITSHKTLMIDCKSFSPDLFSQHAKRKAKFSLRFTFDWSYEVDFRNLYSLSHLINETAKRNRVSLPFRDHRELQRLIFCLNSSQFILLVGRHLSEEVAGCLTLIHGNSAFFYAAGSSELGRKTAANYALITELISTLKSRGIEKFDFGGLDDSEKLRGINRFKTGFGGVVHCKVGEKEFSRVFIIRLLGNFLIMLRIVRSHLRRVW